MKVNYDDNIPELRKIKAITTLSEDITDDDVKSLNDLINYDATHSGSRTLIGNITQSGINALIDDIIFQ